MMPIELNWSGPFAFRDILAARERYAEFAGPGVYVHLRRHSDGSCERLYVGRASGSPGLMERQIRHFIGSVGLLYYLEPTLLKKGSSAEKFEHAIELLRNRTKFKEQVDRAFDELDSQLVYLAKCSKADAVAAESALIAEWKPLYNKRKERAAARAIVHHPAPPGTE